MLAINLVGEVIKATLKQQEQQEPLLRLEKHILGVETTRRKGM